MKTFKEISEFLDDIDYPILMQIYDVEWCIDDGGYINWVDEGDVYNASITDGEDETSDYIICNADNEQGSDLTYIFPLSKRLTYDDFEEKYEL